MCARVQVWVCLGRYICYYICTDAHTHTYTRTSSLPLCRPGLVLWSVRCVRVCTRAQVWVCAGMYTYMYICTHAHKHTYTRTSPPLLCRSGLVSLSVKYMCVRVRVCMCARTFEFGQVGMYICIRAHAHTHMYARSSPPALRRPGLAPLSVKCVYMSVCVCAARARTCECA